MAEKATAEDPGTETPPIPEGNRPNLSGEDSFGGSFEEPETVEGEPAPRQRKRRSDAGVPRGPQGKRRGRGATADKAAAGATILYGGMGMILMAGGIAPAAGMSMQGLADEAGPDIAEWAKKRSPRFYKFLQSLSDTAGIGKYIGAPVSAEAYVRLPAMRPALEPVVISAHGEDMREPIRQLAAGYDEYQMAKAASKNGHVDGVEFEEPNGE